MTDQKVKYKKYQCDKCKRTQELSSPLTHCVCGGKLVSVDARDAFVQKIDEALGGLGGIF